MPEHVHSIEWVYEGPLWFCACGAEFFPKAKPLPAATRIPTLFSLNHGPSLRLRVHTSANASPERSPE